MNKQTNKQTNNIKKHQQKHWHTKKIKQQQPQTGNRHHTHNLLFIAKTSNWINHLGNPIVTNTWHQINIKNTNTLIIILEIKLDKRLILRSARATPTWGGRTLCQGGRAILIVVPLAEQGRRRLRRKPLCRRLRGQVQQVARPNGSGTTGRCEPVRQVCRLRGHRKDCWNSQGRRWACHFRWWARWDRKLLEGRLNG